MAQIELASIPRALPQFGRSPVLNAIEVWAQQGTSRFKGSCGRGGGKVSYTAVI